MQPGHQLTRFERLALVHLDAAYNLARWLTRNDQDAEDLVQETFLRAFQSFDRFHGDCGRAWILTIVRNTFYTWRRLHKLSDRSNAFDEQVHSEAYAGEPDMGRRATDNPERLLMLHADLHLVEQFLNTLPVKLRETLVLREFEGLSYRDIADITGVPRGTVMSRLSRARKYLQHCFARHQQKT